MIIQLVHSGVGGAPVIAQSFKSELLELNIPNRIFFIPKQRGLIQRLWTLYKLIIIIGRVADRKKILCHFGIESIFLSLLFQKNIMYVNHGLALSNRLTARFWSIAFKHVLPNCLFIFVNKAQADNCNIKNCYQNYPQLGKFSTMKGKSHKIRGKKLVFGLVGSFSGQKNNKFALRLLSKYKTAIHLHCINPDKKVHSFLRNWDEKDYTLQKDKDISSFFDSIDILIVPSRWESFSLVS